MKSCVTAVAMKIKRKLSILIAELFNNRSESIIHSVTIPYMSLRNITTFSLAFTLNHAAEVSDPVAKAKSSLKIT